MWLDSIHEVADLYCLADNTSLKMAKIKLSGSARSWARYHQFADWHDFQRQLQARYGESKASAICRLERCWQCSDETAKDFADRYLQDAEKAGRAEDDTLVYSFTQRLLPELRIEVARQCLDSIEAIVDFCEFWSDMNAPLDENRAAFYPPAEPLSSGAAPRLPRNYIEPPMRSEARKAPRHRPPFKDTTNTSFGYSRPEPQSSKLSYPPGVAPAVAAAPAADAAVEELTKKFQRLELNVHHQLQDKDREIRTLRLALKTRQERGDTTQFNYMSEEVEGEGVDTELLASLNYMIPAAWEEYNEGDLDQELLASLMAHHTGEGEPQLPRAHVECAAPGPYSSPLSNTLGPVPKPYRDQLNTSRPAPR